MYSPSHNLLIVHVRSGPARSPSSARVTSAYLTQPPSLHCVIGGRGGSRGSEELNVMVSASQILIFNVVSSYQKLWIVPEIEYKQAVKTGGGVTKVIEVGVGDGVGTSVGLGDEVGVGVAIGVGGGVGVEVGLGVSVGNGVEEGEGVGRGVGDGVGEGDGVGVRLAVGVGATVGVGVGDGMAPQGANASVFELFCSLASVMLLV